MPDILLNYHTWLHTLPPLAQPIVGAFVPSLPVWLGIAIFERKWIAAHGPSPAKKISVWIALPVGAAMFYFKDRYPEVQAVLEWPDKHIPGWHLHWWQMVIGVFAAGFVAKWIAAAFAALFLRGGGSRGAGRVGISTGRHTLLPNPPDGFGWFSSPTTTRRIVSRRTFHTDEED